MELTLIGGDPNRLIERFEAGVVEWCGMAMAQLVRAGTEKSGRREGWTFLASTSDSARGRRQMPIHKVLRRASALLEDERDALDNGDPPSRLVDVRNDRDAPAFAPGPLRSFLAVWSDLLWRRLGVLVRRGPDRVYHAEDIGFATTRAEYEPPQAVRQRRERPRGAEGYVDSFEHDIDEQLSVAGPAETIEGGEGKSRLDEVLDLIGRAIAESASTVYFNEINPSLGRRINGVVQAEPHQRRYESATGPKQLTRIFVAWRRIYIAVIRGDISLRAPDSSKDRPMFERARHLTQALVELAKRGLIELERPDLVVPDHVRLHGVPNKYHHESRRAVGHLYYMLEQQAVASGRDDFASLFGTLLKDLQIRDSTDDSDAIDDEGDPS